VRNANAQRPYNGGSALANRRLESAWNKITSISDAFVTKKAKARLL